MSELDIQEGMTSEDKQSLEKLVGSVCREGIMVAEIGSWKGDSTRTLAKSIAKSNGKIFAIDHWRGNKGTWSYGIAQTQDIYSIFKHNMIALEVWDMIHPLVMDSQTAVSIFADSILDLVFIDADHRYEYIKQDILSWLPKLKIGGILCGHDSEGYYSQLTEKQKLIDASLDIDFVADIHPGVIKALWDCFADKHVLLPGRIWCFTKGK